MDRTTDAYRPGEHRFECAGPAMPQDAKSPPLEAVAPDAVRLLQVGPEPYFSPQFLERELASLWPRTWLCAGLARDVAEAGQWLRFDAGRESYLVVRGQDGELRAFHNARQHRGMPLVAEDAGTSPRFVCRFHSWTYDTRGRCTHVMDRPQFQPRALAGGVDLPPLRCATWGAFVFVCADPRAPSLEDYLGPVPATRRATTTTRQHLTSLNMWTSGRVSTRGGKAVFEPSQVARCCLLRPEKAGSFTSHRELTN